MTKEEFAITALDGGATVHVTVRITATTDPACADEGANLREARAEAVEWLLGAIRSAVAKHEEPWFGPPLPEARAKTLLGGPPPHAEHVPALLRIQQARLDAGWRWDEDRRCWIPPAHIARKAREALEREREERRRADPDAA